MVNKTYLLYEWKNRARNFSVDVITQNKPKGQPQLKGLKFSTGGATWTYENPFDILSCIKRVEPNFLVKYRDSHAMHLKFISVAVLGEVKGIILSLNPLGANCNKHVKCRQKRFWGPNWSWKFLVRPAQQSFDLNKLLLTPQDAWSRISLFQKEWVS